MKGRWKIKAKRLYTTSMHEQVKLNQYNRMHAYKLPATTQTQAVIYKRDNASTIEVCL